MNKTPQFKDYPDIVSIKEIQSMLNVGRTIVYKLLQSGEIESIRIGNKYIVPKNCVINFLNNKLQS